MLPLISMECRAIADAELRFAPSGIAVAKVRTACNSRKYDKEQDKWIDDKVCFIDVTCFKKLAENVAESVLKSDLITVTGRLQTEEWVDKTSGEKKSKMVCIADTVSVSLAFRTVAHNAAERVAAGAPADDPWAGPASDDPPF